METAKRVCTQCQSKKTIDNFAWQNHGRNILRHTCKECDSRALELFGIEDEYEARRSARLFLSYGITPDDEARLLRGQAGACAACGQKPDGKRLTVDYCEETATVRGLLCPKCSHHVGWVGEDLSAIRRTIAYLQIDRQRRELSH